MRVPNFEIRRSLAHNLPSTLDDGELVPEHHHNTDDPDILGALVRDRSDLQVIMLLAKTVESDRDAQTPVYRGPAGPSPSAAEGRPCATLVRHAFF